MRATISRPMLSWQASDLVKADSAATVADQTDSERLLDGRARQEEKTGERIDRYWATTTDLCSTSLRT